MKRFLLPLLLICCTIANAQYYYKDIIGTKESAEMLKAYKANKVTRVVVNSYDANNTRSEDFFVEQTYAPAERKLRTVTRSNNASGSVLLTYADAEGRVTKTVDSTEIMISTTTYDYDENGRLIYIKSNSSDTAKKINEVEEHLWQYQNGKVYRMLRIKNSIDTTFVQLKLDETSGNVVEEQSIRKGVKADPVYYYYDAANRLTDIVRYSNKARRLLPEYMFEYSASNQVIQRITVPANSSNYTIWRYQYNADGLKTREAIYDKNKSLSGKIEYQYVRG